MEKKAYICPHTEAVEMGLASIMAASDPRANEEMGDVGNQKSKQNYLQYYEEDE